MTKQGCLLVVDDNRNILTAVQMLMKQKFQEIITLTSPNRIPSCLADKQVDVVLLDMNFDTGINSGNEGLFWLKEIKKARPDVQVVLFTAYADIDLAVKGIKEGAADFVVKPWDNNRLTETLLTAYRQKHGKDTTAGKGDNEDNKCQMFWGESPKMKELRSMIEKVACTDANILITGENGTGKEMLAREIHRQSLRHNHPLVAVDMGALTETLFESELFGYKKGAFTDARTDHKGKFETAEGSTLFLDEIGNLPYHLQAKLLTVLQRRSVVPVGSNIPVPVNIRLICATNRNLEEMTFHGEFREDLLYRINTIHVHLPALRERREDIVQLAELFLEKYAERYGKPAFTLDAGAREKLTGHPWYGNIRELEHTLEKAVIMSDSRIISAGNLDCPLKREAIKNKEPETLEEMERNMIQSAIEKFEGNLSQVAGSLGISRQTLYNKIKRYGL